MDNICFAALACWVQSKADHTLDKTEINQLLDLAKQVSGNGGGIIITPQQVRDMLSHMAGDRKIEAIKELREMTGDGLKEAKDQIEAVIEGCCQSDWKSVSTKKATRSSPKSGNWVQA
jgi:hypothetical protein